MIVNTQVERAKQMLALSRDNLIQLANCLKEGQYIVISTEGKVTIESEEEIEELYTIMYEEETEENA